MQRKKVILNLLSRDQYSIKHLAKMSKGSVQGSARQSLAEHLNHDQWFRGWHLLVSCFDDGPAQNHLIVLTEVNLLP